MELSIEQQKVVESDGCAAFNECNLKKHVCNGKTCPYYLIKYRGMMFYFQMCIWLNGDVPKQYTHDIFEKLWIKNRMYRHRHYIANCLDY